MADFYYCRRADCKCTKKRSPCYPESMARCGQCCVCLHPISKGEPDWGDDSPVSPSGGGVTTTASAIDAILGTASVAADPDVERVAEKPAAPVQEKVERKLVQEKQPEKQPDKPASPRKPPVPQFNRVGSVGRAQMITSSISASDRKPIKPAVPVAATKPVHTRAKSAGFALKDDIMGRDSVTLDNTNWLFDRATSADLPALQRLLHRGPSLANKVKNGSVFVACETDGRFQSEPLGGGAREVGGFLTCEPDQFRPNTFVVGQIFPGKSKAEFLLRQLELQLEGDRGTKTLLCLVSSEDIPLQQVCLQGGFEPCGTLAVIPGDLRVWYRKEVA